ncbi:MAG: HEPN domain-containing protein [Candidatus Sumerlaeota bacterium]|nr:HEPN domain-containing protein [Candidatus Sumerlaeota bacterium]
MSTERDAAKPWIEKALHDLLSADNNLHAEECPADMVCFHCQQAAERFLKASLVAHNQDYPLSHDLLLLLDRVKRSRPEAESLRAALSILDPYAVGVRYPDESSSPSREDAIRAREAAAEV